ncbi:DNA endonuclease RBBP8 isoform X2 [Lates japonicus]|uniref:DNA endonuclease RBBP8 n=1 Tax=Lates japonicus TaxID=270547 RepID=A0AAD3RKM8_LATJO|nr:DNA endonuclease RBBP8 isoform X2 [Lates japonicus]GLD72618.1 DNA endonuclease RBBP8 isoform X2 [Lates japonicus]
MSSPGPSSGTNKPAELFEELWRQLGECHQNALQELEVKVSKLKKERCLDAQRLEVFYNRNQQLKEQNKSLQDTISLLEERLRAGECDQCAIVEENQKNNQDQNLRLIAKLKNERNSLEDENRKLQAELQRLKMSRSEPQQASSPDQDEGIIPDSPVLSSSLPAANKLKKRKNLDKVRHIRYAELPLPQCNNSLFSELNKEARRAEVLVPNTCELDSSQTSNDVNHDVEEVIAETCGLELVNKHHLLQKTTTTAGQRCLNPDSTTERSPSLLPRVKRFPEDDSSNNAKRKKDSEPQEQEGNKHSTQEGVDTKKEVQRTQPQPIKRTSTLSNNCSFMKQVQSAQSGTSSQRPSSSCASPVFKKLKDKVKGEGDHAGKKRNPLQDLNASQDQREAEDAGRKHRVEPMWSIDPALALSMYDSEQRGDQEEEEEPCHGELADTDCTWVSHSLLQGRGENGCSRRDNVSGLGVKANDSLDMMFDTTAYGEYNSYNSSHLGQSQPCDDDDDDEEEKEEEEEEEEDSEQDRPGSTSGPRKAQHPTFAHVAIIRKKDERRKLKGTTCKECEIYYAHLPEEEKQKKLSSCSRHRFLYVPPCTPENFWEVGFPSTQTCIERGYIREEKNPQVRLRRRQPLTALFSPKPEEN